MSPQLDTSPPKSESEPAPIIAASNTNRDTTVEDKTTGHPKPTTPSVRDLVVFGGLLFVYIVALTGLGVARLVRSILPRIKGRNQQTRSDDAIREETTCGESDPTKQG